MDLLPTSSRPEGWEGRIAFPVSGGYGDCLGCMYLRRIILFRATALVLLVNCAGVTATGYSGRHARSSYDPLDCCTQHQGKLYHYDDWP